MFLLIVPSSNFSLAFFQRLSYRIWSSHFFPLSAMESEVPLSLGNPTVFQQNLFLSTERDFTDPLQQVCFSSTYVADWINTDVFGIPNLDLLLLPLKEEC